LQTAGGNNTKIAGDDKLRTLNKEIQLILAAIEKATFMFFKYLEILLVSCSAFKIKYGINTA
jgi:hypothetical protein